MHRYPASVPAQLQRAYPHEKGYVDIAFADYAIDTTGTIALLNTVAQGASVSQRVGKKVQLKGLQCRGFAFNDTTATVNDAALVIVYDKRPTGALPAITDILVTASAHSMNNDANAGRFRILKREDFLMIGNQSLTGTVANYPSDNSCVGCDFYLDLKNLPTIYKAAGTGAIGDIEEGALYIVSVGQNAAGTAAGKASLAFRLRYVDV